MSYTDTNPSFLGVNISDWFLPAPTAPAHEAPVRRRRATKGKRKAARQPNYASANRGRSSRLQDAILALLAHHDGMTLRDIGEAVGISRQLARYHVLKLVAHKRLLVILEACEGNGGVQYRVWEHASLAATFAVEQVQRGLAA